nr:MAG TPA: hypothetical protein [Caudoviricetes sp.]
MGPALKGAQNGLERLRGFPQPEPSAPRDLAPGGAAPPPRANVTTPTYEMPRSVAFALGMWFNEPITAEGAKLPGLAAASRRRTFLSGRGTNPRR